MSILKKHRYGYIKIDIEDNFILEFIVYKKYRGKGKAKLLSKLLPKHCYLLCNPLYGYGEGLNSNQLKQFYKKIGFKPKKDHFGNLLMYR